MLRSFSSRILLLSLLPLILILLYLEGRDYDPALINFKSSGREKGDSFFSDQIQGLVPPGRIKIFTKNNLYEHINGHAEYFISAGFVRLYVGEYLMPGDESEKPEVVVEIYDMGRDIQAYGVLADEAGTKVNDLLAKKKELQTSNGLSFIRGRYYVKMIRFNKKISLNDIKKAIARRLGRSSATALDFSKFPVFGKTVKTRYIKEAYRGLGFLNNVREREYIYKGKKIQISLISGTRVELNIVSEALFRYLKESEIKYRLVNKYGKKFYKVIDPYEGDWYLLVLPDAISGIYGSADDSLIKYFR